MSVHQSSGDYARPHSIGDIIDCLEKIGEEHGCVSVGDIVDALGTRTYAPFLIVPAMLEISPLGAIPGVPTFLALTIAIFAAQMLLGRDHLWIPDFIANRKVAGDKLKSSAQKMEGFGAKVDALFHGRMKGMTRGVFVKLAAIVVLLLCFAVPPLEFLPFASAGPMIAIMFIGLALLVRDGALLMVAVVIGLAATGYGAFSLLGGGGGG